MNEKLERLKTIKAWAVEQTINEPYPRFLIEPEIIEYAKYITEKVIGRTIQKEGITERTIGILGQELFNGFLLQYRIPNIYANPIYKERTMRQIKEKHFDFIVPHMPKRMKIISIKTIREGERYIRFMVNVEKWKHEIHDIAIAIKINNLQNRNAHISGWLYTNEVEKLPSHDFGQGTAYWTYLNPEDARECEIQPLHNATELMQKLLEGSLTF